MKKSVLLFQALRVGFGRATGPSVYIEPQQRFETYLAAEMSQKNVVTGQTKATYVLKPAPVEVKSESINGRQDRALFICLLRRD